MKRIFIFKWVFFAFVMAVFMTISCEKNMTGTVIPTDSKSMHIGKIGLEIDDASGVFRLFIDGKEAYLSNGLGKTSIDVSNMVTLTDVDYTPLGCDDYPANKVRTISLTFTKKNEGTALSNVYSVLTSTLNVDGVHAVIDVGDNNITDGETFNLSVFAILSTCSLFGIQLDLDGTVN